MCAYYCALRCCGVCARSSLTLIHQTQMLSFPLFALLGAPLQDDSAILAPEAVLVKMPPTADLALQQRNTLRRHLRGVARLRGHIPHTHEFVLLPQPGNTAETVMQRVRQLCPDAKTRAVGTNKKPQ